MLTWLDRFFARGAYLPTTGDAPDIDSPPSWQPTITQLLANQLPDDFATHPLVAILAIGKRLSIYAPLYIFPIRVGLRHEPPGRCIERALGGGHFRGGDALEPAHHAAAGGALLILSSEAQKISGGQLSGSWASGSSSARMAGPTAGSTSPVCSPAEQNFGEHSSAESRSEARAPS